MNIALFAAALAAQPAAPAQPVLHYLRSNSDGTQAEQVVVYVPQPGEIHVFKAGAPCTTAAYVIARSNPANGQTQTVTGGRLTREGTQSAFAWFSKPAGQVEARVGSPEAEPMFSVPTGERWFLYDFDFADWIARPPVEIAARQPFSLEMLLLLVGENAPSMTNRGAMDMAYGGEGSGPDGAFLHYRATGPALDGRSGDLWFRAGDARLIAARLPLANHDGYRDFALTLVRSEDGEAAWRAVLAAQWAGCPAAD